MAGGTGILLGETSKRGGVGVRSDRARMRSEQGQGASDDEYREKELGEGASKEEEEE